MASPSEEDIDAAEEEENEWTWQQAGIALGTILGGGVAVKYGRKAISESLRRKVDDLPEFIGKTTKRSRASTFDKVVTATVQADQPIRSVINEFLGPTHAKRWGYKSDVANNVAIGAKVKHQLMTGRMVGTDRRTVPLAPVAQAFAKELSLDEQKRVGDALLAASTLDDVRRTGVQSALNVDKNGNPVDVAGLERLVRDTRADPRLSKYMDHVQTSFRDILEFRVARGTMSQDAADEFMRMRPNYVKMKRDVDVDARAAETNVFNANRDRGGGQARNVEENSGVQGGAVGNPFNVLFDDWADEIRRAELNDLRVSFLDQMAAIPANGVVRRIPNGVAPKTNEGLHTVWQNGKETSYHVSDPLISRALEMTPRASIQSLEQIRQIAQNVTTGPIGTLFNGFSVFVSPLYDTGLGMLNRPKGMKMGLITDAYTGAIRYMWDDVRGAMATNLADQMIRANTPLRNILGDNAVALLRDRFAASYEASTKAFMDEQGITSLTMHGTPDPTQVISGLHEVAPAYADDAARIAAQNEGIGLIEKAKGNNAYLAVKGNAVSRAYGNVVEAMHNGFRYSQVARNRDNMADVELASKARRISADAAQHGLDFNKPSEFFNKATGSFMYANLAMQALAHTGRSIAANPTNFMFNLGYVGTQLAALHYIAMATDPEAKLKHDNKSAAQKTTSVTTFGGAEIRIDPILRTAVAPAFALLDHLTGADTAKWDGNFMKYFDSILEGGEVDKEALAQDTSDTLWEVVKANNPFNPTGQPIIGAAMAGMGIDTGMSRVTGEPTPVRTQALSGEDPEAERIDGMGSAWAGNMVSTVLGVTGDSLWQMADDATRALNHKDGSVGDAMRVMADRYKDNIAKGSTVFTPLIFGNREPTFTATDTNTKIARKRMEGIEQYVKIGNLDVRADGTTGSQLHGEDPMTQEPGVKPQNNDIIGTKLDLISEHAAELNNELKEYRDDIGNLGKDAENVRNWYFTKQQERQGYINKNVEKRRYLTFQMLNIIRERELVVREQIGDPDFTFDQFDPEKYKVPLD
jgi:hypothetical protein